MHHRGSCLRPACGEWIHMYWIEIAGQTGEENLVVLIERSRRQRYPGHAGYRSIALVWATLAPTSSNDSMSATPNFTPSSISTAAMKLMYFIESQFGTSSLLVCMVSLIDSSD